MRHGQKEELRSPLKDKPLRQAGESTEAKRLSIVDDGMSYVMAGLIAVILAVQEWVKYFTKSPVSPWTVTCVAVVAVVICMRKIMRLMATSKDYREGRDGERVVAERLEELRQHGFKVLHDIVAGDFNIDHVLIGPSGIFVIETKTLRKKGGREEKIEFDGKTITVNGRALPRDPVSQVQANARWLREYLQQSSAQSFPVTPVVILPGWFVTLTGKARDVIVINDHPKGLRSFIVDSEAKLSLERISTATTHLSMFVRAQRSLSDL